MPRVRAPVAPANVAATPIKIPLNDDREEKAKRLQSRQAFQEMQRNSLKAAASPARKRKSLGAAQGDGPSTPRDNGTSDVDMDLNVAGSAVTPMKRVPILANFEEWMKMATDNKINAANSWNFALIDYFHDMSLLKEGDGVNFQKASCTLDGCVKIYTSRVDSVATETGKLLSGLADSGSRKKSDEADGIDGEEGDEDEGEDGARKRTKKKSRSSEKTLVESFDKLQPKKMELDFSIDPLFKKASADFDEGGAKGLLLNQLSIDNTGRIVFDSSDDVQDDLLDESRRYSMLGEGEEREEKGDATETQAAEDAERPVTIDIAGLAARFFPDLSKLDSQDLCPSLKMFELGDGSGSLDLPFIKAAEDWRIEKEENEDDQDDARSGVIIDDDNAAGFDDDDVNLGGFDIPADVGFGEGGEAWAREAHIEPQIRPHDSNPTGDENEGGEVGNFEADSDRYAVTLARRSGDDQENILSYFDQALQKNWAGPEHWKIKKIKDAAKAPTAPTKRKEKEPFEIDFATPMTQLLSETIYTKATSDSVISLPKTQWKSKTRNRLPDDIHFSSRDLLRLFLKPKARLGTRKSASSTSSAQQALYEGEVDEEYWAANHGVSADAKPALNDEEGAGGDYDANFFQDDGLGIPGGDLDDASDFADAHEVLPTIAEDELAALPGAVDGGTNLPFGSQEGAFGAQLITQSRRIRPEYLDYARKAKKVDVRRLKEEMWKGIGLEPSPTMKASDAPPSVVEKTDDGMFKFTDVINNLKNVYPKQQMNDISTSYCFICLLHLANEKGLVIENTEDFNELTVRRDTTAEITGEAD